MSNKLYDKPMFQLLILSTNAVLSSMLKTKGTKTGLQVVETAYQRLTRQHGRGSVMFWTGIIDSEIVNQWRVSDLITMTLETYIDLVELMFSERILCM